MFELGNSIHLLTGKCLQGNWQRSIDENNHIASTAANLDTQHLTAHSGNYQSLPQKRKHCVPNAAVNSRSKLQDTDPSNSSNNVWKSIMQPLPWALSPHIAQRKVHRYCTQRMAYHIHLIAYKLIQAARMEPNETDILHMEVLAQAMLGRS